MDQTRAFPQPLIDAFRAQPRTPAFEYQGGPVSRGEALEQIARCHRALADAGLGPGSAVVIATEVCPGGFAAQLAALLLGCRVTGLRPGLTPGHLAHVLRDADALVADGPGLARPGLAEAASGVRRLRLVPDLLAAPPAAEADLVARGRPHDVALVNLTSGSTGPPKGSMQTYAAMTAYWSWRSPGAWHPDTARLAESYQRFLLFGTLTSFVMLEHLGLCLHGGGTAVIPAPPPDFPGVFARHRVTACLMTVPRLYRLLDEVPSAQLAAATGSLRALLVAGSPLAPHRLAEAARRIGAAVHQGYGLTETGLLTLLTPQAIADGPEGVLGSVGRPWAGSELSVRDAEERPVPPGTTGEIWARNSWSTAGYWQDEEQTSEILRAGWVRTRDLGHLDSRGNLHLTGRARDVVIVNAIVHYAGPIERVLASHPDVDEAYVAGAPDELTGEAVHAFVVPVAGRTPEPAALRALVRAELGEGPTPATVTRVPKGEVPTLPSGKPDKRALLDRLR